MNSIFPQQLMKEEGQKSWIREFNEVRNRSTSICEPLHIEDYVVQPVEEVSPPKWHLAHSTWFFEIFLLKKYHPAYKEFNPSFAYLFNSYYEALGDRVRRVDRGNLSRPGVQEIFNYRKHIDGAVEYLLENINLPDEAYRILEIGLQHEQQHQELLFADIKYILGHNPLFPAYKKIDGDIPIKKRKEQKWIDIPEGIYDIGHQGNGFAFDNELRSHKVFLQEFSISTELVTNREYLEFLNDGAYEKFEFWHSDAWEWIKKHQITKPLYWHFLDGQWHNYTLNGLNILEHESALNHISYYEAYAFAQWKGLRLPTEFEWEAAADNFLWGQRWEWTNSAYLQYPGFIKAPGAIGEYNGKFMINQMVLRGGSELTAPGHSRKTYRNFFQPNMQWQYSGIRLAQ